MNIDGLIGSYVAKYDDNEGDLWRVVGHKDNQLICAMEGDGRFEFLDFKDVFLTNKTPAGKRRS